MTSTNDSRSPLVLWLAIAFAVGVVVTVVWRFTGMADTQPSLEASRSTPAQASRPSDKKQPAPADFTLLDRETITIDFAAIPLDRPLLLDLALPVASPNSDALKATIVDVTGRRLDVLAEITGETKLSAYLEIEAGWLSQGTYLIHLITNERTHLPLRRYPLIVR